MTYLELLRTLHDNGATTTASLLAALNDNALLAALGVADSALVDALKHDITASNVRMALLVGDSQYRTEHFATEQACRAYCEDENASIIKNDYQGNKNKWLNDAHALEWLPVSVAEWLDYMPFNNHPLHGYICQQCGKPSPVGVGFVTGGTAAFRASHGITQCECGYSAHASAVEPEQYRFEHGHLYEYSPEQNAYIHCFVAHGCNTMADAVSAYTAALGGAQ